VPHALSVQGPNGEIIMDGSIAPGGAGTLEADLDRPGTYKMYCPIDGHRAKGMTGTITVGGSPAARGAQGTTSTTATQTTPGETETTRTETQTTTTETNTTPNGGTPSDQGSGDEGTGGASVGSGY
jgi:hypothetical protein